MDREVTLLVNARHFRCRNLGCGTKIFVEPLRMAAPYMRKTHKVQERITHFFPLFLLIFLELEYNYYCPYRNYK